MPVGTPQTWFAGKSAPEDKHGPDPAAIGAFILLVISPIGAVVAFIGYMFFSVGRFSWKIIGVVTGVYFALFLLMGGSRPGMLTRYTLVIHDLRAALTAGKVSEVAGGRWPDWLIAQLPLSILVGLVMATGWSAWKWVRRPSWQNYDRRPSPVEVIRRKRNIAKIGADQDGPTDGVTLGVDEHGRRVVQTDQEASAHTLVTGSSGSGKTLGVLMKARDMIRRGDGIVYVDLKGGPDVPVQLAAWAARYGRPFLHWSINDSREPYDGPAETPAFYDPVGRGDASRRKDLIAGAIGHSANGEIYQRLAAEYLQVAFKVILAVPAAKADSLMDVMDMLNPVQLRARAVSSGDPDLQQLVDETLGVYEENGQVRFQMDEVQRSAVKGTAAFLRLLVHSTAGAWLRKDPDGRADINLRDAADRGAIIVFSLDSSNYEDVSKLAANLIIQDLKTLSSELRKTPGAHRANVIIDEFSATGSDNVLGLLARARDSEMPVILATQALADLRRENEAFLDQVLGIVNCFVIHRANTEHDAEVFAGLTGKEKRYKVRMGVEQTSGIPGSVGSGAATGQGHVEEVDEYRVMPHEIQQLKQGQMVFIANTPGNRIITLNVILESVAAVAQAALKSSGDTVAGAAAPVVARTAGEHAGNASTPGLVLPAGFDAWADEPSVSENVQDTPSPLWDGGDRTGAPANVWGGKKRGGGQVLAPAVPVPARTTVPSFGETEDTFEKGSAVTPFAAVNAEELPDGTEVHPVLAPAVKRPSVPLLDLGALRSRTLLSPVSSPAVAPVTTPAIPVVRTPAATPVVVTVGPPLARTRKKPLSAPWLTSRVDELGRPYSTQLGEPAETGTTVRYEGDPKVPSTTPAVTEVRPSSVFAPVNNLADDWS